MILLLGLLAQVAATSPTSAAASAAADEGSDSSFAMIASVERVELARCVSPRLHVRPLDASIQLDCASGAAELALRLQRGPPILCPRVEASGASVLFHCRSGRVDAAIAPRGRAMELRSSRGLPWHGEDPPPPLRDSLGKPGDLYARVRAADQALLRDDVRSALAGYRSLHEDVRFGALADERICEVVGGKCLTNPRTFDAARVAPALREDMLLRGARARALLDGPAQIMKSLALVPPPVCGESQLCRKLLLLSLRAPAGPSSAAALGLYFALPFRESGPLADELFEAAANLTAGLGAPKVAAQLFASRTRLVPLRSLGPYLLRIAELYRSGADEPHAAAIVEYARTRLDPRVLGQPRWVAVASPGRAELGAAQSELAAARTTLGKASSR